MDDPAVTNTVVLPEVTVTVDRSDGGISGLLLGGLNVEDGEEGEAGSAAREEIAVLLAGGDGGPETGEFGLSVDSGHTVV